MSAPPEVTADLAIEAYGVRFVLAASDRTLLERMLKLAPPGAAPAPVGEPGERFTLSVADGEVYRVLQGEDVELTCKDLELALSCLEALVHEHVAIRAPERIFVTAGAVEFRSRAIVVLGPALGGKSTLVSALVRSGAKGWADRYAVFDQHGLVHRYGDPAPAGIAGRMSAGADCGADSLRLGMIVATEYRPGARWNPRAGTDADGVLSLLAHALVPRGRLEYALRVLRAAAAGSVVLVGERGEAGETARAVLTAAADRGWGGREGERHGAGSRA